MDIFQNNNYEIVYYSMLLFFSQHDSLLVAGERTSFQIRLQLCTRESCCGLNLHLII